MSDVAEVERQETTPSLDWRGIYAFLRPFHEYLFKQIGDRVLSGPFNQMIIPVDPVWDDGNQGTKLFGTYEHELHGAITHAISRKPKTIVNIGCAEGYYAIGLARALPEAEVHAFDISLPALEQCAAYAHKNEVADRIVFHAGATKPEELILDVRGPLLYVVDCEGHEWNLLNADVLPDLNYSDLIIECHDFLDLECQIPMSHEMMRRFVDTHYVQMVTQSLIPPFIPQLADWPIFLRYLVVAEKRPAKMCWVTAWAKNRGEDT